MITTSKSPLHVNQAIGAIEITPNDSTPLTREINGLYVGADGDAVVVLADGSEVTLKGLIAGTIYPMKIKQVKDSGTTADDLVGLIW